MQLASHMQLASQKMLPETLAAVVRAMSAPRALAPFEQGAVGPSKDCAYEGPIMKAIAGVPISMEGKSAACAHFSPVGNIASACAISGATNQCRMCASSPATRRRPSPRFSNTIAG
jgi:Methanol-cobalamin methyltransferase B subunit